MHTCNVPACGGPHGLPSLEEQAVKVRGLGQESSDGTPLEPFSPGMWVRHEFAVGAGSRGDEAAPVGSGLVFSFLRKDLEQEGERRFESWLTLSSQACD